MNREQKCKELVELNGGCWHEPVEEIETSDTLKIRCSCGKVVSHWYYKRHLKKNPTFSHPEELLEVMDKRKDGKLFYAKLMYSGDNVEAIDDDGYIDRDYIKERDKLFTAALDWCREHPKEGKDEFRRIFNKNNADRSI